MRRTTGLPTLVVMCRPCKAAGEKRKLGEFDLAASGPSQTHHTIGAWSGPDGDDKVHLRCGRGHEVQVRC